MRPRLMYGGSPCCTPRSKLTIEPNDGWKVTNAPQFTGTGVGRPVIR